MSDSSRVLIVGAGLAGLACARRLQSADVPFLVLEASDAVGGRVRTDQVDGFRLDRGFQVLLDAYPEASRVLDYDKLRLRPFAPGALVRYAGRFHSLADPWRRPLSALSGLVSPIGTLSDKLGIARLRRRLLASDLAEIFRRSETTTLEALSREGFSTAIIERFFRPFLGGVFLDRELQTSSRMFEFVFKMFSAGSACLPSAGMQAIPEQLAAGLVPETLRLGARVDRIEGTSAHLASGAVIAAAAVVVAVDGSEAMRLISGLTTVEFRQTSCFYFAAPQAPLSGPWLILNGESEGPINNLCVVSEVASGYAPEGQALVSVTVVGATDGEVQGTITEQLGDWFGSATAGWRLIRSYVLPQALPAQPPGALEPAERPVRSGPGLYVCGDHRDNGSIQGALVSGRRTAEAILADLDRDRVGSTPSG